MKIDLREIPVFYINLKEDTGKKESMERLAKAVGFKSFTRVEGVRLGHNAKAGCAASHFSIMRKQKPPFIVLEDDCRINNFLPLIEVPDDADAIYLGISSWGRLDGRSGPNVLTSELNSGFLRIYNMLSTHAMLFLSERYCTTCALIAEHSMYLPAHVDVGYAEVQKFYNIYAFDNPMFSQTSSKYTDQPLTSYDGFHQKKWCWVKHDNHSWPSMPGYVARKENQ